MGVLLCVGSCCAVGRGILVPSSYALCSSTLTLTTLCKSIRWFTCGCRPLLSTCHKFYSHYLVLDSTHHCLRVLSSCLQVGTTIATVLPYSRRPAGEEATGPALRRRRLRYSVYFTHLPACLDLSSPTKVEDAASPAVSSWMADCTVPVDQYVLFLTISEGMLNYFAQRMS